MDAAEMEENLFAAGDAKLHGGMYKQLSVILFKVLGIFPILEAARPRSKSGIQALCSLHVALDKAKNLLLHCSECSKLYLAITGDSVHMKFEKAKSSLQESLKRVEDIVPQAIGCQIMEIVSDLERTGFTLDEAEKKVGDEVVTLLQKETKVKSISNDGIELEIFYRAASKLGITSSRAALTERRALKKLIERARAEEDKRKESIVAYLLYLMRKYSKLFRNDLAEDTDSQGSAPCSPTIVGSCDEVSGSSGNGQSFERNLSKLGSFNFKRCGPKSGFMPIPPEGLRCPISLQLMYDPVIISSGQTYERVCIEKWFNDGHNTCPKTQQELPHLELTPNYCVKGLIASWCEQNDVSIPDGPPESLDLNYWRLAFSESEAMDSRSLGSIDSCKLNGVKAVPMEESGTVPKSTNDNNDNLVDIACHDYEVELKRYKILLAVLNDGNLSVGVKQKAVEEIRLLLKDDEEARIYMGANGFVEALVGFLGLAIDEGDDRAQEVGSMSLFNLCINNNRNKEMLFSAGVIQLLETMILNPESSEPATALYLNLSCLDDAKPVIGSSEAVPFLIDILRTSGRQSISCKHDALYSLYNLSTHPPNVPSLIARGTVDVLHSLLRAPAGPVGPICAVLINLASAENGTQSIMQAPGLIGTLAGLLETGELAEQEQAVTCLLILCNGDESCIHMLLREGVIPSLVSLSANGSMRGKDKAKRLLRLFREQRQREPSPVQVEQRRVGERGDVGGVVVDFESKLLRKSRSARIGKSFSSMWKKSFTLYHC